jgi:hypothetical protein
MPWSLQFLHPSSQIPLLWTCMFCSKIFTLRYMCSFLVSWTQLVCNIRCAITARSLHDRHVGENAVLTSVVGIMIHSEVYEYPTSAPILPTCSSAMTLKAFCPKTWWFHKLLTKLASHMHAQYKQTIRKCTKSTAPQNNFPHQNLSKNFLIKIQKGHSHGLTMEVSMVNYCVYISKLSLLQLASRGFVASNGIKHCYIATVRKMLSNCRYPPIVLFAMFVYNLPMIRAIFIGILLPMAMSAEGL